MGLAGQLNLNGAPMFNEAFMKSQNTHNNPVYQLHRAGFGASMSPPPTVKSVASSPGRSAEPTTWQPSTVQRLLPECDPNASFGQYMPSNIFQAPYQQHNHFYQQQQPQPDANRNTIYPDAGLA